jgi:uncharacterized protein YcgI (DUF1989 family)
MSDTTATQVALDQAALDRAALDRVGPGQVVLDQEVPARGPWSAVVVAGDVLTIVDLRGNQAVDCLQYNPNDTLER